MLSRRTPRYLNLLTLYEPHGHLITGDLRIVRSRKLRRLLEKGPKYREQNIAWHLNKEILTKAVDDYAKNWSKREGCHVSALEEWSETVKLIISNRINSLQYRSFLPCNRILEDPHIKAYLTKLQSKYVLVPADKAANNIIFVCKYYYIHTLMEELGINSGTNLNSTQDPTVDEIIQTHATTLEDVLDIKLQQREKNLPQIYWIPKLHKTPPATCNLQPETCNLQITPSELSVKAKLNPSSGKDALTMFSPCGKHGKRK